MLVEADRSWRSAVERHPDLAPAVQLQRRVISRQLDLGDGLDRSAPARIELRPERATEKLRSETPLLLAEPVVIDLDLTPFVVGFCDDLAQGEAGGAARRLAELLVLPPSTVATPPLSRSNQTA